MNTKVTLAGVELKNPVMTCSGTFGSGMEYGEMIDLDRLGAEVSEQREMSSTRSARRSLPRILSTHADQLRC